MKAKTGESDGQVKGAPRSRVKWRDVLQRADEWHWLLPQDYKPWMRVPGLVLASDELIDEMADDQALEQIANVASLPGIVKYSMAMPDVHCGYGFPIGGVAAMRPEDGVISPGGVGFDINCGTRVLTTHLQLSDVQPRLKKLIDQLFRDIPAGLGERGQVRVPLKQMDDVLADGAAWAIRNGYGLAEDETLIESGGRLDGGDPALVSRKAKQRGASQLGTLGSGNHFLEVQVVDEIYDSRKAEAMGISGLGQVLVFIHTGSRGLGHQTCQDHLDVMEEAVERYRIRLPDKQLACAPIQSDEGRRYIAAMSAAGNFAFCNRQVISHFVRQTFARIFESTPDELGLHLLYDVSHNTAKLEEHDIDGASETLLVHRKGATRAFGPGHSDIPERYRSIGQPVLVPGDMGRYSYLCLGTNKAMAETWGSTCHGAGRLHSRHEAKRMLAGVNVRQRMLERGIYVRSQRPGLLAEEASEAYKDVSLVIDALDGAGIAIKVCRMRPLGVVKG
jgi:tRNA-splicing ligase RtcB